MLGLHRHPPSLLGPVTPGALGRTGQRITVLTTEGQKVALGRGTAHFIPWIHLSCVTPVLKQPEEGERHQVLLHR